MANEGWKSIVRAISTRTRSFERKKKKRENFTEFFSQSYIRWIRHGHPASTVLLRLRCSYHRKFLNRKDVINRRGTKAERRSGKAAATEAFTLAGVERL